MAKKATKAAPDRTFPAWKKEPYFVRLHKCVSALVLHGVIGFMKSEEIHAKIQKMQAKALATEKKAKVK